VRFSRTWLGMALSLTVLMSVVAPPLSGAASSQGFSAVPVESLPDNGFVNMARQTFTYESTAGVLRPDIATVEVAAHWDMIEHEEGVYNWALMDEGIRNWSSQGKKVTLALATADNLADVTPEWLFEKYNVRRIIDGQWDDFEMSRNRYTPSSLARLTEDPSLVLAGSRSLAVESGEGGHPGFLSSVYSITPPLSYSVQFDVKALADSKLWVKAVPADPAAEAIAYSWTLAAGDSGTKTATFRLQGKTGEYKIVWGMDGPGSLVLDHINAVPLASPKVLRIPGFPNYFDPVFREKYEKLVSAMAERYANHPGVNRVIVGGVGRWEEVMLDNDVKGTLDPQWLSLGYNKDMYLEHIRWCMELYKKYFPEKQLLIQMAYGLHEQTNRNFIYRRVAQLAVERGIGIKQNGMSQLYDTWDAYTDASYMMNRMRHKPGIPTIYEAGSSIGPNTNEFFGHPISFINRAMLDGVDGLYMFPYDVASKEVNPYFHYAHEQMGRAVFTKLYARLGDFSGEQARMTRLVKIRNIWQGLRQYDAPGATPVFTTLNGEKTVMTAAGNSRILFDVDDRQQYNTMYGTTISVDYYDQGTDRFSLSLYHNGDGTWQTLGTVQKTGTGQWKTAVFHDTDWADSPRNSGQDVQNDLIIDDLGDGTEAIRYAEINFVPAGEWREEEAVSRLPGSEAELLTDSLSMEFTVAPGTAVSSVEIPVWTANNEPNGLTGTIYKKIGGTFKAVTAKEYFYPADKDWFHIPIPGTLETDTYRIVLDRPEGSVGWYKAADGSLAYRVNRYATEQAARSERTGKVKVERTDSLAAVFESLRPFNGVDVEIEGVKPGTAFNFRLYKKLGADRWSAAGEAQTFTPVPGQSAVRIHFMPQTEGVYRMELEAASGDKVQVRTIDGQPMVSPLVLVRKQAVKMATHPTPETTVQGWTFSDSADSGLQGWTLQNGFKGTKVAEGRLYAELQFGAKSLTSPDQLRLAASKAQLISFRLKNGTGSPMAKVSWKSAGMWKPEQSVLVPIVANDAEYRTYAFPIGRNANWTGVIDQLVIEPVTGHGYSGAIEIGDIAVTEAKTLASWQFDYTYDAFYNPANPGLFPIAGGVMEARFDTGLPRIMSQSWSAYFFAEPGQKIELKVKNDTDITDWLLRFRYKSNVREGAINLYDQAPFSDAFTGTVPFTMTARDDGFTTYTIDPTVNPLWKGELLTIYVEAAQPIARPGALYVDSIRIYRD